ncbi:MAG: hypothetical protein J2P43_07365 [Candidatus Dormibacteraeota bacterium]|nr:hypothetical protein [Candidatus Dormibacteraeota bacterium]
MRREARARLRSILPELLAAHHDLQDGAVSDRLRDRVLALIASDGVVVAEDAAHRVLRSYSGALHVRLDGDRATGGLRESNGNGGRYQLTVDPELLSPETCVELIVTAALAARPAPAASTASLGQAAAGVGTSVAWPREVERPASGPPVPGDLVTATAGSGHDLRVLANALQVELTRRQG